MIIVTTCFAILSQSHTYSRALFLETRLGTPGHACFTSAKGKSFNL